MLRARVNTQLRKTIVKSENIKFMERDIDIMLESKMKDEALFRLVRQLKYKGYKVIKNSIILKNLKQKKQDNS